MIDSITRPRTLVEKIWDDHVVIDEPGAPTVLAVDLHLVHEVTSPQAFTGLRSRGLTVRRPAARTDEETAHDLSRRSELQPRHQGR
jgi:homoaconitase/3-isopropylmalate dehydratase large subunit